MATDFTQDSVLVFLQSCGGLVKNTELLLHFKPFLRDHPDEVRNRELFKKFVNSVATVTKIDGVSNVVLRNKFRGHVPSGGSGRDSAEPCPVAASSLPAVSLAPPGDTERKSALPAAGIMVATNNLVESSSNLKQRDNLSSEPASRPAQVGNQVPGLPETPAPDQSNKRGQNRLVSVPTSGVSAVRHQDYIPEPIRGQQVPPQDPMSEPIRGHIVSRQDYTPEPARKQEMPHQDLAHVPIRRLDTPHQGNIPEPIRGHIVSRQDNVPDPVGRWDLPHKGTISEPLKRHIVSRQDHAPEPIRGQHITYQNPVPDPLRGQKTSHHDRITVEPSRGHIINRQDHFPGPVRGQQILHQSPYPASSRGWDTPHQDPIPGLFRGNIISRVPEFIRGQNISYQDHSRDPLKGWEISSHNPIPQPLRGQQIPQNLEPPRGQQIPYQVPVPQSIREQKISYQDPIPELLRGQPIPRSPDPVRGQPIPRSPDPVRGQQIPRSPDPVRGQQIPRSPDPVRGQQIPQNLEHLRGRKVSYEDPVSENVRGQNISHQDPIPESHVLQQIPHQDPDQEPPPQEAPPQLHQVPARRLRQRQSYKSAVSQDEDDEQVPIKQVSPGGQWPLNVPLSDVGRPGGQNISHQDPNPEPIRGHEPPHQDAPPQLHQVPPRRLRQRQSYKSAVSQDEDEEQVPIKWGSAGGQWPLNAPLSDVGRAISASSPCITESTSPSSSSGKKVPQIYIQDSDAEVLASQAFSEFRPVLEPGSVPVESMRRSLPSEAERYVQGPQSEPHFEKRAAQALEPEPNQSQRLSSSHSSISNPLSDVRFSISDGPPSGSFRTSGWDSSTRADEPVAALRSQEVLHESKRTKLEPAAPRSIMKKPLHQSMGNLYDDQQPLGQLSPLYLSSDHLHDDQQFTSGGMPMHMSTDDLYDDGKSSDGSIYSPYVEHRPSAAHRTRSRLRSRVCRSLGTDLDQLLQEEPGGGIQAARLERLHRISSSLSLPHNLSSSSLSSCATPPRCPSPVTWMDGEGRKEVRRSHQPYNVGQSPVPLEAREHAWMVKGAAGAWPDIYSLFREDASLLNRQDFISGFTVLHWIAKHGDTRVLNTLWYGVEKSGLSFNVNAKSTGGQTPLHIAAIHGHKNMIRLLVKKFNADVKLRDTAGKKPWQYLNDRSHEILQLLGAPPRAALTEEVGTAEPGWKPPKPRQGLRHHFSSASSAQRPLTVAQMVKVTRSSSVAALLKHKALHRL